MIPIPAAQATQRVAYIRLLHQATARAWGAAQEITSDMHPQDAQKRIRLYRAELAAFENEHGAMP